ncbi:MAG TPA: HAMP domain-containing sensor histidine kinase [Streptosporangiaceae bacterium]|nr:HAMP domain-containing sensor histidine kinase [Streptosporangiaceae bacterium]
MTTASWLDRAQGNLRRLSGRTPIRVKIIAALLALVIIALTIISAASLAVFRNYQIQHANQQVTEIYNQETMALQSGHGPNQSITAFGPYLIAIVPNGSSLPAQAASQPGMPSGISLPNVPTSASWYKAHGGRLINVDAVSGSDNWQIVAQQIPVVYNLLGQPQKSNVTLIVGVDLGDINGTIGWLARIDMLVSLIIVVALAVVGVAIVQASLRPLTDIEQTAQAIAAGDLSRRVPDLDPRTEVGRLARSLNRMLAQIESSFRARTKSEEAARRSEERMRQFVADASHELRTPLTAMRGYAEYYRQRGGVQDDDAPGGNGTAEPEVAAGAIAPPNGTGQLSGADLDRIMQRVEQESARMGVLVEDMLLLARLDQQRPLEQRPVDLLTLAADAVQDARMIAPDRDIELNVGSGAAFLVLGDEVRLRQVIGNLMSNALNHTPDGTPVTVRILPGPREPVPSVVLEVTDQGPGMLPEQAEHVFERFYRGDQARTRKSGGTGLGLAIVAALVAAHGGSVALKTTPGEGATFRVTLPLAPEAQRDEPADDESVAQG